jgi:hypothetical protein
LSHKHTHHTRMHGPCLYQAKSLDEAKITVSQKKVISAEQKWSLFLGCREASFSPSLGQQTLREKLFCVHATHPPARRREHRVGGVRSCVMSKIVWTCLDIDVGLILRLDIFHIIHSSSYFSCSCSASCVCVCVTHVC